MFKKIFKLTFELIQITLISLAIIIPVRYFLIQPFYVKGASMQPNFYDHDYLIIDQITYRVKNPQRGDIIVFHCPDDPQEYYIKRIIGLPGETIQFKNGEIYVYNDIFIDGFIINEPYLQNNIKTYTFTKEYVKLVNNEYFVLGDNRGASKDSRVFGAVHKSFIVGRVLLRGWPFNRFDLFKTPEYQLIGS
ncbi:signal peptidase I [Patescibacteria group bacterium]|nr:signal peptidase I [Patescibacteria group bacterium]